MLPFRRASRSVDDGNTIRSVACAPSAAAERGSGSAKTFVMPGASRASGPQANAISNVAPNFRIIAATSATRGAMNTTDQPRMKRELPELVVRPEKQAAHGDHQCASKSGIDPGWEGVHRVDPDRAEGVAQEDRSARGGDGQARLVGRRANRQQRRFQRWREVVLVAPVGRVEKADCMPGDHARSEDHRGHQRHQRARGQADERIGAAPIQ